MKMCQAFSDNGHEVVLLAPDMKSEYEKNVNDIYKFYGVKKNFEIIKLWHPDLKGGAFFYLLGIFFYLFFNKKFDLVYGRFLQGCYIATLLKNKVIFESHAPIFEDKKHKLIVYKKLIRNKYFKKMIVISKALKNMYLKKGYLNNTKIQVAHDGADEVKNFNSKIQLLGCKNNLKVGYVGHLYKGKGMEVVASLAKKVDDDTEIHIIGGLEKDIKLWREKIINKNIYFYGFVPPKEVGDYINAMDVCLLPNQKIVLPYGAEPLNKNFNISTFTSPLKLFEYMSHKKAIIASDLPVIREILNEKNSILVKCDDIKSWINSIQKLKNFKNRDTIAKQALIEFYNYTWKNRAMRVL
jgi:glycosyltransferase involved in cell wall biosynthesis